MASNTLGVIIDDPVTNTDATSVPNYTTASLDAIQNKVTGMTIYDSDTATLKVWDGAIWKNVGGGGGGSEPVVVSVDTDYDSGTDVDAIVVDATTADVNVTLPWATARPGHPISVVKTDVTAHHVIVSPRHITESIGIRGTTSVELSARDDYLKADPVQTDLWQLE